MSARGERDVGGSGGSANRWALAVTLCLSAVLVASFARVVQLQLAPGERLGAFVGQRTSMWTEGGWRGDILDRRGRPLAISRLGYRAFIDPLRLGELTQERIDGVIDRLARAMEMPAGEVRTRVMERLGASRTRLDEGRSAIRFARIGGVLSDEQASGVRAIKAQGVHLERVEVRESITSQATQRLVGLVGAENEGRLGAEWELDAQLREHDGSLRYLRDSRGRPLWVEQGAWHAHRDGQDVRLSIDLELQRICEEELWRGIYDADAVGGRLVMLDPRTGEVLAMLDLVRDVPGLVPYPWEDEGDPPGAGLPPAGAGGARYVTLPPDAFGAVHPALGRNRCVQDMYEPGSTFKPFVWSAVTQSGLADPGEVFETYNGFWRTDYGRSIEDVTRRARMTWSEVLVNSSNIGMVQGAARMEPAGLRRMIRAYGFGEKTGIRLPGEMGGLVTPMSRWTHWTQTSVAFGHEVAVTPIQMARAFCCFARTGERAGTLVDVTLSRLDEGDPSRDVLHRVVDVPTAVLVRRVLTHVAEKMEAVMRRKDPSETGWRYRIFGKSGTAEIPVGRPPKGKRPPTGSRGYFEGQYNSSFIAGGPYEDPRLVVLVVIDDPGPSHVFQPRFKRTHYGSHVAGPVVRRVLERSLGYLGVPASDPDIDLEIEHVNDR